MTPEVAASWSWVVWLLAWTAASVFSPKAARRAPLRAEWLHWSISILGVAMLVSTHRGSDGLHQVSRLRGFDPIQLWVVPDAVGWALVALGLAGFGFCWWARLHLGRFWSGSVTLKQGHKLVDTGPFALVRHPIYTGFIVAALAMAALRGTLTNFAGLALVVLGFWLKAGLEERFLADALGREAYGLYAARTPMLLPRLWPAAAKG